jgi:hypothetical protein
MTNRHKNLHETKSSQRIVPFGNSDEPANPAGYDFFEDGSTGSYCSISLPTFVFQLEMLE